MRTHCSLFASSACRFSRAKSAAVFPSGFLRVLSAPAASNTATASTLPFKAASINGVVPCFGVMSGSPVAATSVARRPCRSARRHMRHGWEGWSRTPSPIAARRRQASANAGRLRRGREKPRDGAPSSHRPRATEASRGRVQARSTLPIHRGGFLICPPRLCNRFLQRQKSRLAVSPAPDAFHLQRPASKISEMREKFRLAHRFRCAPRD